MDPSRFNGTTMASSKETEALRTTEQGHVGATSDHDSQANPSAPLLQFGQNNPEVPGMEPPPYSSVVTQDSQAWRNHPGTFSTVNGQAPYPTGPAPYPTDGAPTFEALSEAPYPKAPAGVAPESVVSPRYSPPMNQGTIYPTLSGAGDQYYPVQKQYQQNQVAPLQTVYVVQNNADTSTTDVCCIALDCCICCDAFLDCLKICFGDIDNDS
ncbi:uncharacterized protein LOC124175456 [Neodiprion fabricii]|uniref:uncharacterized protein LOC124175456 n=1 Tax=Neodiprion fabricii TaxID=2872261 RepID=UPI001ED9257C|nr:uncharacterized protein LOC124175456 [Neodiprion fabricii]